MHSEHSLNKIKKSVISLEQYILGEDYRGYDPYDALLSPLFSLPLLNSNKFIRLGSQQVIKRLPFNIRKLLGIRKSLNPVSLGLCLQAFTYLSKAFPEKDLSYREKIDSCILRLIELRSRNFSGYCWGYNFDWEAKYARIPAYAPTVVATGFITNALYTNYKICNNHEGAGLCLNAVPFVMNDLNRVYFGDRFCFSYSPFDKQAVYNATLKGARILLQAWEYLKTNKNGDEFSLNFSAAQIFDDLLNTVSFVADNQNPDGSWSYSKGDSRTWVDNFHTGYVLDVIKEFTDVTGMEEFEEVLAKGRDYYFKNFFYNDRIPRYYDSKLYPVDSTSAAQAIITSVKFGRMDLAVNVALWMIDNMQDRSGFFYYQKKRFYTNKISYIRWSNAWMFAALSFLLYKLRINDPV